MSPLDLHLRLSCSCCSAHHLTTFRELEAGAFLCSLCERTSEIDRLMLRCIADRLEELLRGTAAHVQETGRERR